MRTRRPSCLSGRLPAHRPGPSPAGFGRASRIRSFLTSAALFAGISVLAPAWFAGCREEAVGGTCVGGVVIDGVCQGKCTPDKCAYADNTCVANRCVLVCTSHLDCHTDGSQICAPAAEDDTNASILVCQDSGHPAGTGVLCPLGTECEAGLTCESKGEADPTAYCTKRDCAADTDCLSGYYCGVVRDPHELCGSDPKKGNDAFCGETKEPCESPGASGTSLFEGSLCLLRRSCLQRGQAAPCQSDVDCSWIPGQVCADVGGDKRCTRACVADVECQADTRCDLPPGSPDGTLGACLPRFGAWIGEKAKFCEPCLSDEDCGGKGSTWACADLADGMRGCFDGAYPDACQMDADCPVSPGGKHGSCLDERFGLSPSDPQYHRCTVPTDPALKTASCW